MSQGHHAPFWADQEAGLLAPDRPHVIRDSKTPSGDVPISALRGPIISDALYRTFKAGGLAVRFVYTIDDYDPMDSASMRTQEGMARHMGKPLFAIPSPDPDAGSDFADYHATRFISLFAGLGITPEFHRMRDLYRSGALDPAIDLVLRKADLIREIYARVSNVKKEPDWYPVMVICESCGRIGTTKVTGYDGAEVSYECLPTYVRWAEGCGNRGTVSPFKGNAKLPWNLQWCAQWDHFDVTYEEGGKDLLTGGGSRERSNEIYRRVWGKEPPPGLIHEFFLIGGRKMASSKGLGAAAAELVAIYPPELVRFLLLRTHPKRHVEFDPAGVTLPKLVDEYDRCADAYGRDPDGDLAKIWRLSQVPPDPAPPGFRVRFGLVADWLQIPSIAPEREAETKKGAPLDAREQAELRRRVALARVWLERWAPDEAKYAVLPQLPDIALTDGQRAFLSEVKALIGTTQDPDTLEKQLYEAAKRVRLVTPEGRVSRDAFAALYLSFIGKPNGPRAAWLLTTQDPAFVRKRLAEASRAA